MYSKSDFFKTSEHYEKGCDGLKKKGHQDDSKMQSFMGNYLKKKTPPVPDTSLEDDSDVNILEEDIDSDRDLEIDLKWEKLLYLHKHK